MSKFSISAEEYKYIHSVVVVADCYFIRACLDNIRKGQRPVRGHYLWSFGAVRCWPARFLHGAPG